MDHAMLVQLEKNKDVKLGGQKALAPGGSPCFGFSSAQIGTFKPTTSRKSLSYSEAVLPLKLHKETQIDEALDYVHFLGYNDRIKFRASSLIHLWPKVYASLQTEISPTQSFSRLWHFFRCPTLFQACKDSLMFLPATSSILPRMISRHA